MENKKTPVIMLSGYYGFENAGDEAILASITEQLHERLPGCRIIVLSQNPAATSVRYGTEACTRTDYKQIFKLMGGIDVFVSGGGGLVQDATGFNSVLYYLGLVQLAKLRGKKTMLYAHGLGPLNNKKSRIVASFIMNQVDLITYRDENSKKLSDEIGIKKPKIRVTADPVFALKPESREKMEPVLKELDIAPGRFKIGISARPWVTRVNYTEMIAELADRYHEEKQADIFLFPFQKSMDLSVCKQIQEKMKYSATLIDKDYTIKQVMALLGEMDAVIGMRLHALIFSAIQGVPCTGVSYDPKVTSLMEMLGLKTVNVMQMKKEELFEAADYTITNSCKIRAELPSRTRIMKEKAELNTQLLIDLIN